MKCLIFSVFCVVLQVRCQNPKNHWTLLPNILVVEVDGSVGQLPLTCLSGRELPRRSSEPQDIYWRRNGVDEGRRGNSYLVQLEESLGGGNYSCHSRNGSLLNHTEVLIREDRTTRRKILVKSQQGDYLKCAAHNYSGEFRCWWTWHASRVGSVAFIRVQRVSDAAARCSADAGGGGAGAGRWACSTADGSFLCAVDAGGRGVSCADRQHCPYGEESRRILLTVFLRTRHFLLEDYSKDFLLSDIVKPDQVRISAVNSNVIEWSYPSSWSSPYSYFPLTFEIAQLRGRCKRCENPCSDSKATKTLTVHSGRVCQTEVKHKVKAVCIRAKDALCNSQWSEWSHFRLKRGGKRNRQRNQRRS
ncbi:interleukin 12Ba [Betta splendens]|uniref:Interleukin-12 subunit beta n=1 Tax=Betta splendens TaxID=158456 RepID=A0A6P7NV10_BETSP|nr:interleukin 12Ba [Betta splendens]